MSGVPMMPLSRSADIVARVLSRKLSLMRQLGYDLPLGFASNAGKGLFVAGTDKGGIVC
jgi:hypothetical protein